MNPTRATVQLPILYSFRRCPYAMRARLALLYSGQRVELREVLLKNKPPEMLDASPKATVPVLVNQGRVLDESLEIMQWALDLHDPDDWLSSVDGSVLKHDLIEQHDIEFKPKLDRYKYFDRFPEFSQADYLAEAMPFLQDLDDRIRLHNGFLARSTFSALDAAIFPFIRQFAYSDLTAFANLPLPDLQQWLNVALEMPLFLKIMKKYPPWSETENNAIDFCLAAMSN